MKPLIFNYHKLFDCINFSIQGKCQKLLAFFLSIPYITPLANIALKACLTCSAYDVFYDGYHEYVKKGRLSNLQRHKSLSCALLISRYVLRLGQRGRCCFCAACPNRKMYLEIRTAKEGAYIPFAKKLKRTQDNLMKNVFSDVTS